MRCLPTLPPGALPGVKWAAGTSINGWIPEATGEFTGGGVAFSGLKTGAPSTAELTYAPGQNGAHVGSVRVLSNGGFSNVSLVGNAVGPQIAATREFGSDLYFGSVPVDGGGLAFDLEISNGADTGLADDLILTKVAHKLAQVVAPSR